MGIYLNNEQDAIPLDAAHWTGVAEAIAQALGVAEDDEWSLTFVDTATIQQLNADYRGFDKPTDVLSFSQLEGELVPMPEGEELPEVLGDVVIAVPVAERQANERGHSLEAELALLITHGLLHLLGEDHDTPERKAAMWARQGAVLEKLGYVITHFGDD